MNELIGKECSAVFSLPSWEWPIAGYPARVVVEDVDMPMVKLRGYWGKEKIWVNASIIQTIRENS